MDGVSRRPNIHAECADRQGRLASYRGTGRISIFSLESIDGLSDQRAQFLRPKNVQRLKPIFATEGCDRLEPANSVPVLLSQTELDDLTWYSQISPSKLYQTASEPPLLQVAGDAMLKVLHGSHRLEAARQILPREDAWWTVDLNLDDMDVQLRTKIHEEYATSANFSDGEIFRHIRFYHKANLECEEKRWWARLTRDKSKDLKRILEIQGSREGFDSLLNIPGLWDVFHIGTMRRYLLLRCHQELANYLARIFRVRQEITGSSIDVMRRVDAQTVKALELRAPAASSADFYFLKRCIKAGTIFANIEATEHKDQILSNIGAIELLIPSLFTFCEDTKHLGPCAKAVKMLIEPSTQSTIRAAFLEMFKVHAEISVPEDSEQCYSGHLSKDNLFESHYRQTWLFAFRHFPNLVNIAPRKEPLRRKPTIKEPDPVLWYRFARPAVTLGFRCQKTQHMGSDEALDRAKRSRMYAEDCTGAAESLDHYVQEIQGKLEAQCQLSEKQAPELMTNRERVDLQHRCGRPFEMSQEWAKEGMFLDWIFTNHEPRGQHITPFFVLRSTFLSFFGNNDVRARSPPSGHYEMTDSSEIAMRQVDASEELRNSPFQTTHKPISDETTTMPEGERSIEDTEMVQILDDSDSVLETENYNNVQVGQDLRGLAEEHPNDPMPAPFFAEASPDPRSPLRADVFGIRSPPRLLANSARPTRPAAIQSPITLSTVDVSYTQKPNQRLASIIDSSATTTNNSLDDDYQVSSLMSDDATILALAEPLPMLAPPDKSTLPDIEDGSQIAESPRPTACSPNLDPGRRTIGSPMVKPVALIPSTPIFSDTPRYQESTDTEPTVREDSHVTEEQTKPLTHSSQVSTPGLAENDDISEGLTPILSSTDSLLQPVDSYSPREISRDQAQASMSRPNSVLQAKRIKQIVEETQTEKEGTPFPRARRVNSNVSPVHASSVAVATNNKPRSREHAWGGDNDTFSGVAHGEYRSPTILAEHRSHERLTSSNKEAHLPSHSETFPPSLQINLSGVQEKVAANGPEQPFQTDPVYNIGDRCSKRRGSEIALTYTGYIPSGEHGRDTKRQKLDLDNDTGEEMMIDL